MNARSGLDTLTLLARDTFRQAWASGIGWLLLTVTALCVLLCLSVGVADDVRLDADGEPGLFLPPPAPAVVAPSAIAVLGSASPLQAAALSAGASHQVWSRMDANPDLARREGIETIRGRMTLAFGAVAVPVSRDRIEAVHFLELLLGEGLAGLLGLLLALVWTAGFVPAFLDPSSASVLLAKPVPRWQLLLDKYFGVLAFLGSQIMLFVVATWLALGLRTGVWDTTYFWSIPLLLVEFAIFFSFSLLLGVVTRSTAASIVGSVLFWLLAWAINYGSVMTGALPEQAGQPALTHSLAKTAYWLSPKPIDAGLMLFNALDAHHHFEKPVLFQMVETGPGFSPALSILSSLSVAAVLLALSVYEFNARDY